MVTCQKGTHQPSRELVGMSILSGYDKHHVCVDFDKQMPVGSDERYAAACQRMDA